MPRPTTNLPVIVNDRSEVNIDAALDPGALRELATRHFGPAALN